MNTLWLRGLLLSVLLGNSHLVSAQVPVEVASVRTDTLVISIDTVGNLRANEAVVIRPEVDGIIQKIHFSEGSKVAKGTTLITLDDRIWRAELKQAQASLQLSQINYKRAEELRKKGVLAQQGYDEAVAELRVSRANVELAKTRLTKTVLKAPFTGKIGLRRVSVGDYVVEGQEIVSLQDINLMKVDFNIPEINVPLLEAEQAIQIRIDALPDEQFTGKVYALDSQLDLDGRSIAVRAIVPNEEERLRPGFFARVSLIVENRADAMLIPEDAIVPQGNDNYVFVVNADNNVDLVQVQTGLRRRGEVEIYSGLTKGQLVVTAGQLKLRPGTPVAFEALAATQAEDATL